MTDTHPRCATCGSRDVVRDAWATWDVATAEWVLGPVFDHARCQECDADTQIVWPEPRRIKEPNG